MNHKEIYETLKQLQMVLRETDERISQLIAQQQSGVSERGSDEIKLPLTVMPAYFKGKKPLSILYPDGTEVGVRTWKQVALQLMRGCAENETMASRLEAISGKVWGRDRMILGENGDGMDAPLKIREHVYLESKFDTESLIKVITNRIFAPIGYDYQGIQLKVVNPALQNRMEQPEDEEGMPEEPEEDDSERETFSQTM